MPNFGKTLQRNGVSVVTEDRVLTALAPLTGGGALSADRSVGLAYDSTLQVVSDQLGVASVPWGSIASTPTTITGYGITDALKTSGDNAIVGGMLSIAGSNNPPLGTVIQSWKSFNTDRVLIYDSGIQLWSLYDVSGATESDVVGLTVSTNGLAMLRFVRSGALDGAELRHRINGGFDFAAATSTTPPSVKMSLTDDGKLLIAQTSSTSSAKLQVTGDIVATGTLTGSLAWSNLTSKPTTIAGYGLTDAQALDADLTAIAALGFTATAFLKKTAANTWALDTNTYLTGNQAVTLSGDATGSGATAIAVTLAASGVGAGTYRSVTVDTKGRVTAGTNPTTIAGYGLTNVVQPYDATLTAISGLAGTVGFVKQTSAGVFGIDANAYSLSSHNHSGVYVTPTYTGNVVIDGNFIVRDSPAAVRLDVNLDSANLVRLYARNYAASAYQALLFYASYVGFVDTHYFSTTGAAIGTCMAVGNGAAVNTAWRIYATAPADNSSNYTMVLRNAAGTVNSLLVRGDNYFAILGSSWANLSDARRKRDIFPETNALASLLRLQPVCYRWIRDVERDGDAARRHHGFIAQQVQPIYPEMISEVDETDTDKVLALDYTDLIGPLVSAIQELHRRITALEAQRVF